MRLTTSRIHSVGHFSSILLFFQILTHVPSQQVLNHVIIGILLLLLVFSGVP